MSEILPLFGRFASTPACSQDWCVAAAEGADVPEVHLVWCCRFLSEMALVGEAFPSLIASAGEKKDTHFSMSLYCSGGAQVLFSLCCCSLLSCRCCCRRCRSLL